MSGRLEPPRPGGAPSQAARARVLLVDDEASIRRSVPRLLLERGFEVDTAEDAEAALALLASRAADVLLLDLVMPTRSGLELIPTIKQRYPEIAIVGMATEDDAVGPRAAVDAGAYDVVTKPLLDPEALARAIGHAAEHRRSLARMRSLERRIERHERFGELVGTSTAMREVARLARGVAPTAGAVLLLGERGTGKQLVARMIHDHSTREGRPFRVLDCGALPEALLPIELFGSVPGAFPGALDQAGVFEQASPGTVFLDDIGALPLSAQAGVLAVLAHRVVQRAGQSEPRPVDARIVAAAGPDLRDRVKAGTFREDLFYRLNVVAIALPPLRRRKEDIPLLAYHFLQKCGPRTGREVKRISVEALRALRAHPWPGNVGELEAAIERAAVLARGDTILPGDLPLADDVDRGDDEGVGPMFLGEDLGERPYAEAKESALTAFDRLYVDRLMKRASGNVSEAARLSGMDRSNFRRLMKKVQRRQR